MIGPSLATAGSGRAPFASVTLQRTFRGIKINAKEGIRRRRFKMREKSPVILFLAVLVLAAVGSTAGAGQQVNQPVQVSPIQSASRMYSFTLRRS